MLGDEPTEAWIYAAVPPAVVAGAGFFRILAGDRIDYGRRGCGFELRAYRVGKPVRSRHGYKSCFVIRFVGQSLLADSERRALRPLLLCRRGLSQEVGRRESRRWRDAARGCYRPSGVMGASRFGP